MGHFSFAFQRRVILLCRHAPRTQDKQDMAAVLYRAGSAPYNYSYRPGYEYQPAYGYQPGITINRPILLSRQFITLQDTETHSECCALPLKSSIETPMKKLGWERSALRFRRKQDGWSLYMTVYVNISFYILDLNACPSCLKDCL